MRTVMGLIFLLTGSPLMAATWVLSGTGADSVFFQSDAKLEFLEGKTVAVAGYFDFNADNCTTPVSGRLRVDLTTLNTGIEMRDHDMRSKHLHTDKYPHAWFELSSLTGLPAILPTDSTCVATVGGWFYIHGVKRPLTAQLRTTRYAGQPGDRLDAEVRFSLRLDDYKIPRPKALVYKLAEVVNVQVRFTATAGSVTDSLALPDWPEQK